MPISAEIYYHIYQGSKDTQAPAVILIHGAGGDHLHWPSELRRLPGFQVYALDLPGHGKSAGRGMQSINAYRDVILGWMSAVGLHKAYMIGHSMGSAIALSLALEAPLQVAGLGLLGAGARLRVAPEILENVGQPSTFHSAVRFIVQASFSPTTSPQLTELASRRMEATRPSVLLGDFLACNAFDTTASLLQIGQPALVISGEDDKMTPPRYAQFLADKLPHAELRLIPETGHMLMLEKPRQVAQLLREFLVRTPF